MISIVASDPHAKSTLLNPNSNDYIVLECPTSLLESIDDETWVFRGSENDPAVLCTSSTSYGLSTVKTTNTHLFLEEGPSLQLAHVTHDYLELTQRKPTLDSLWHLLFSYPLQDPLQQVPLNRVEYTFAQLLDRLPVSEGQLRDELYRLGAFEMHGVWNVLDVGWTVSILHLVVLTVIELDMDFKAVRIQDLVESGADVGVPELVMRHVLSLHCTEINDETGSLSLSKITATIGKKVLLESHKSNVISFLTLWKSQLPIGFEDPDLELLNGWYLVDESDQTIRLLIRDAMPQDPKKRMEALFEIRPKWSRVDLLPFVSDLAPVKGLDALLLKFSRVSKVGKAVYYTCRSNY